MATYEITAPDGQTYEVTAPDNASESAVLAYAKTQFGKPAVPSAPTFTPSEAFKRKSAVSLARGEHPYLARAADTLAGLTGTLRGGIDLAGGLFGKEKLSESLFPTEAIDKSSGRYIGGQIADPYAQVVGLKAMQAAKAIRPAAGMLQNVIGGTAAGSILGAASEDGSAVSGGMLGGAISAVAPPVLTAAAKGFGWAIDLLKGRLSEIKAGKVLRDVAGEELPKIQAALQAAGQNVTASQAAAPVGSTRFAALGERAAQQDSQFTSDLLARQAADREAKIAALAGGPTQTAARQAIQDTKASLTGLTNPMREAELGAANQAGILLPKIQGEADTLANVAANKVQDVRRFTAASERAPIVGREILAKRGMPAAPVSKTYMGELADTAEQVAGKSAADSLLAGEASRFAQARADSLKAHGLTPLNTDSITGKIVSSLNDPKLAGSKPIQNVMSNVAKEIEEWTAANGGVIDAQALYSIRKNAVASEVSRLNPSATEKTQAKMTASILGKVSPLIDDAIEAAGGTGWRNYLQTYADGMGVINRMKLGGEALKMLQKSPDGFMELVKGNNPKAVQKIFSGEYDVAKAMGEKFKPMREVSAELERDTKLKELASTGGTDLANILGKDAATFRLPNLLSRPALVANKVLDVAEESLNKKVMAKVYNAMRNGKDASALMNQLSTAEQNRVLQAVASGNLQPYLSSAVVAGAN